MNVVASHSIKLIDHGLLFCYCKLLCPCVLICFTTFTLCIFQEFFDSVTFVDRYFVDAIRFYIFVEFTPNSIVSFLCIVRTGCCLQITDEQLCYFVRIL